MEKTMERKTDHSISVDIEHLAAMLGCGRATARQIGEDAGAKIVIGKRVLFSVSKVEKYIESITG